MNLQAQLKQYQQVKRETDIVDADPHRLIQMLMDGALERLATARGCIERGELENRNNYIGKALDIIAGLQGALSIEKGGDIAQNLDNLYDYMQRRLFDANRNDDVVALDEVTELLKTIKSGWDEIRDQVLSEPQETA